MPLYLSWLCHSFVTTPVIPGCYHVVRNSGNRHQGDLKPGFGSRNATIYLLGRQLVDRLEEGCGNMLQMQERQDLATGTDRLVRERPVPTWDLIQHKRAIDVVVPEQESDDEILRVLDRAAHDNGFIAELTHRGSKALEGYGLTLKAKAALLSGDIRWIEAHVGKLDARLRTWPDCRLQQEIW